MSQEKHFWVRVYDYVYERDQHEKGIMLDEFYLKSIEREEVKQAASERYASRTAGKLRFAKPKKSDGLYAIIMGSNKFYYDRFYATIDTHCFFCLNPISGKASEFPRSYIGEDQWPAEDEIFTSKDTVYFCTYAHKEAFSRIGKGEGEGEFQVKEEGQNGDVFGYIYLIYNRVENAYYIGQTRFMPFFRWQEHVKDGAKGDISDLSFSVMATIRKDRALSDEGNQKYLNSIEAWWIAKYQHEGHKVMNISKPRITVESLRQRFNDMVAKQPEQAELELA